MTFSRRGLLQVLSALPLLSLPGSQAMMRKALSAPKTALTDSGPWLRDQIANANGYLQLPPGVYSVGVVPHSRNPSYLAGFFLPSGFKLCGSGRGNTIIQLLPNQPNHAYLGLNQDFDLSTSKQIELEDLCFDGNAVNQGTLDAQVGVSIWRASEVSIRHCLFIGSYGTTGGANGPLGTNGEGTHCDLNTCSHAMIEDCAVIGGPSTATGFSLTNCTDVAYVNCSARLCAHGQGFTCYESTGMSYTNCQAVLNGVCGFNCELCSDARYQGCIAGGLAAGYGTLGLYTVGQALGNGATGINCRGSSHVLLSGCTSSKNGGHGVAFYFQSPSGLRVIGGQMQNNTLWGVYVETGGTDVLLSASPLVNGNGSGQTKLS